MVSSKKKRLLAKHMRAFKETRSSELRRESTSVAKHCERRILRRLNTVSAALKNVRPKDVLAVERQHKLELTSLLRDIKEVKRKEEQKLAYFSLGSTNTK